MASSPIYARRDASSAGRVGAESSATTKENCLTTNSAVRPNLWAQLTPNHRVKLVFLAAGFLSFLLSVYLWFFVDREIGIFVGLWVPALHSLGSLVLVGERSARDG